MALSLRGVKSRYEVKEVIARGGMGVVYKAHDKVMKRAVALKTLLDLPDANSLKLFQKECEDLASLIHPNIVEIFDVGQLEDEVGPKPYLVMPLLPGTTLDKLIRDSSTRLTVERCVDIFCQTCRGLFAAHERGLVHRDLKPSNIFVMDDDSVKIIDFGVAHRLDTSQTVGRKGTLLYMSPEQIAMRPLTPASDIFSLGIVCYEALTRRRPFERSSEEEVVDAILHYSPPAVHELNPSVPVALSQAIHKAMAKSPAHRYRSAREFGEVLQKALHNEPIELFNPARIRPRLQRAHEAYDKGDYEYASEIVAELEAEGHLDRDIGELREQIDHARTERRVAQLIETARIRLDEQEYQIALQKIDEALQIDPKSTEALALKARVDTRRIDQDIEGWFEIARNHLDNRAFGPAREALRRVLELRPREPRATQLLSEVERMENSQQRLRLEKDGLYRAAVEAEKIGDISSAVSKLERLLELDKTTPEPARTGTYQRLYDKVRSEYDSVKAARTEAKRLLDDQRFPQALAVCNENLAKFPGDTLFQALKFDVEEKQRQAMSARIAESDRNVEAEPDLDRRVSILEEAVRNNPGEAHFERALQNARDKRDMVSTIVARARGCEERGQFNEGLAQWGILQTIYPRYPGLNIEIDRLNKRHEQSRRQEAKARWVEQIDQQLEAGDFARAGELVRMADQEFPSDRELEELERLAQNGLERHGEAQRLLSLAQDACHAGEFDEGIEHLRKAHELDANNHQIRTLLVETLVERGRQLVETDPPSAEKVLNQALELEPNQGLATGLLRLVADQRKVETIDRALAEARRLQAAGDAHRALEVIGEALASYPNETRLIQARTSLGKSSQELRRRDLEQAKRLVRAVDNAPELDQEQRTQYAGQLDRFMTQYAGDEEFRTVVQPARRRLQTSPEALDATQVLSEEEMLQAQAAAAAGDSGEMTAYIEPPEAPPVPPSRSAAAKPPKTPKPPKPKPQAGSKKPLWIALGSVAGVLLLAGGAVIALKTFKTPAPAPAPGQGSVTLNISPAGATVYINGAPEGGAANGPVTIKRAPGTYDLEIRRAGYQPFQQKIGIGGSATPAVNVALVPELPILRILGSGQVVLDSGAPTEIKDGQFEQQLAVGDHTVQVAMNRSSQTSFKVHVDANGLPVISELKAKEMAPLIVSDFGEKAKVYAGSAAPMAVQLNGQAAGNLGPDGLDLPPLTANSNELAMADGKKRTIDAGPGRTVTVQLEADPNEGQLVVQTNEDNANVVLLLNGKEYTSKTTQNKQASFAHLRARGYTVQVTKDGYDSEAPKPVTIAKGQSATLAFNLRSKPMVGAILVRTLQGAQIFLDGKSGDTVGTDGSVLIPSVAPGQHRVEARLKKYVTGSASVTLSSTETRTVEIALKRAGGTVQIQKDPADAVITYRKVGDAAELPVPGTVLNLPEGTYEFIARANGYSPGGFRVPVRAEETTNVDFKLTALARTPVVPTNSMEALWPKGAWTLPDPNGWYIHRGDGFLGVTRPGPAVIQFDALLSESGGFVKSHKIIWATNYNGPQDYLRFELSDKNLTIKRIGEIKENHPQKTVPKSETYRIQIDWRSDSIAVRIGGTVIDEIKGAPGEYSQGRFGFLGNKDVQIQNFRLQ
ncbi:MAG TPA: protein kinase [Bryobacteraceae bacterium]|nr:protein kinase [Bryobacteraceae bacterium]